MAWVRVLMANPAPLSSASGMAAIQKFREDWKKEYYFATLLEDPSRGNDSIHLWDRRKIVELVKEHARRLPWAQAMRIGE